jgi:hypothetical protein
MRFKVYSFLSRAQILDGRAGLPLDLEEPHADVCQHGYPNDFIELGQQCLRFVLPRLGLRKCLQGFSDLIDSRPGTWNH